MPTIHSERLQKLRQSLADSRVDGMLVSYLPNIFYLCGFSGSNAALLVLGTETHLFTDGRYTLQAREEAPVARVHIGRLPPSIEAANQLKRRSRSLRLGFEPAHTSQAEWLRLK